MSGRTAAGIVVILALVGVGGYLYRSATVPPDCGDAATLGLVRTILVKQFDFPKEIQIINIRTVTGGLFATRFECDATVEGVPDTETLLGFAPKGVHYTSEITEDTHRHYVTAQPRMMATETPK
jgi:hypothetical protein